MPEPTNLLPPERQRAIFRNYLMRFSVVAAFLTVALVCAAALLLLPTYVFLAKSSVAKKGHLASIESALSAADEASLSARLSALASDATQLSALRDAPSGSAVIRQALAVPHPGVILSGFTYTPTAPKKPGTLAISGTAATRGALRAYQLALQSTAFATSADVPVSAYAKDTDIAFAITVTLAP